MQEELVSFKVAKLAKEKGFNLSSPGYYSCDNPSSGVKGNQLTLRDWEKWTNFGSEDLQEGTLIYSAPTQFILQKWLREVHNINITISIIVDPRYNGYYCEIRLGRKYISSHYCSKTYEDSLEFALEEALKLI